MIWSSDLVKGFSQVIRSSDKILIKTLDQVKKHNFDQLKFDQVIVSQSTYYRLHNERRFQEI